MSSEYKILCLSHNPALETGMAWSAEADNSAALTRARGMTFGEHKGCDLVLVQGLLPIQAACPLKNGLWAPAQWLARAHKHGEGVRWFTPERIGRLARLLPEVKISGVDVPVKARKKPVENSAMLWTGNNVEAIERWIGPDSSNDFSALDEADRANADNPEHTASLYVAANSVWIGIETGEWIIKDRKGFYPCKADVFAETYDALEGYVPRNVTDHGSITFVVQCGHRSQHSEADRAAGLPDHKVRYCNQTEGHELPHEHVPDEDPRSYESKRGLLSPK